MRIQLKNYVIKPLIILFYIINIYIYINIKFLCYWNTHFKTIKLTFKLLFSFLIYKYIYYIYN